jgi:O-antigen/teichoic acid export membrane protein
MTARQENPAVRSQHVWVALAYVRQLIGDSVGRRAFVANSGWLLFDKLVRALLGLLVGAWVARYLGPAQFGTLAYVVAFIALFQAIANLSGDAIVVRDLAQDRDAASEVLGSALALRLSVGLLCWLVAVACVAAFKGDEPRVVLMAAIVGGVLVFQAADTVDLWFQSQSQSRRTVLAKLCAYFLSTAAKVILIVSDAPLEAFAAVTAFDALACSVSLALAYRYLPTARPWRAVASRMRLLLIESLPFMMSGVSIMVYSRIDQIMIKEMLGDQSLGIYAAALPLSQFWQVIPLTLATSLAPFIAKRKLADEGDYRRALVIAFRAFFYVGVATVVLTWLTSRLLIHHLFGPAYAQAAAVLDIHSVSNVFCFLGIAHGLWLVNERRFAVRLYGTLLAGAITVMLNYAWLPRIGVAGAAYAAIAAQLTAAFLINRFLDPESFRMQCKAIFFRRA